MRYTHSKYLFRKYNQSSYSNEQRNNSFLSSFLTNSSPISKIVVFKKHAQLQNFPFVYYYVLINHIIKLYKYKEIIISKLFLSIIYIYIVSRGCFSSNTFQLLNIVISITIQQLQSSSYHQFENSFETYRGSVVDLSSGFE